jgi:hypothetical protein
MISACNLKKESASDANRREVSVGREPEVNYCKKEKMSICTAGDSKRQPKCIFYEKSRNANRCMYFIFEEYCDCLKAQIQAEKGG